MAKACQRVISEESDGAHNAFRFWSRWVLHALFKIYMLTSMCVAGSYATVNWTKTDKK